ncbi:hypothetical protein TrST_g8661 [Triparma strigata]|nr:hypothetical protein TrST_g8661 [Triparma strigata]
MSIPSSSLSDSFALLSSVSSITTNHKPLTSNSVLTKADFYVPPHARSGSTYTIYFFTPHKQWLDVITFTHSPSASTSSVQTFSVISFSAGVAPASVPACLLFSCLLFFIPFSDVGQNYSHVMTIQKYLIEVKNVDAKIVSTLHTPISATSHKTLWLLNIFSESPSRVPISRSAEAREWADYLYN